MCWRLGSAAFLQLGNGGRVNSHGMNGEEDKPAAVRRLERPRVACPELAGVGAQRLAQDLQGVTPRCSQIGQLSPLVSGIKWPSSRWKK